jgi:hypothetical protein
MIERFAGVAALTALALLAGCGGRAPEAERNVTTVNTETMAAPADNAVLANGTAAAPAFELAADGVTIGTQNAIFSATRDSTVQLVESALGAPTEQGTNPECGAGPLDNVNFTGGLILLFQDGKFVGWSLDGREGSHYRTAKGIGIGSTLGQLREAGDVMVQSTSLGTEFTAGEMSGLLTGDTPEAKITGLWAGTNCAFR